MDPLTKYLTPIGAAICASALCAVLTGMVRRYALAHDLLDIPGDRSSHVRPTPRGGGLAIAITIALGLAIGARAGFVTPRLALALGGGGALVAMVGWIDDRGHVAASVRIVVHSVAAIWALHWTDGLSSFALGSHVVSLGRVGPIIGAFGIVWLINLYNFMDGIDGLSGGNGAIVSAFGAYLFARSAMPELALVAAIVAGSCTGFLAWNWSPARIFMGDVGSGLLGFVFAVFAIVGERTHAIPLLAWLTLLGVFVVDASLTLARRVARGERFWEGHRHHAYQRLVQHGASHAAVTSAVLGVDCVIGGVVVFALAADSLIFASAVVFTGLIGSYFVVSHLVATDEPDHAGKRIGA